ncbi:uncharacterized protein si:ch211-171b20.3 isoform X1 [Oncorhynchus mykiss]|uniref:uncharacterized protein si:ch211-171b20.3 isoform X1 n=1 Tax=Oncorhynchus mykiss TaxID=8022 RepID=UPI001878B5CD|nr:uncharacterized protein si:ch211-171b20.3 isoform X1 [Oncorhynchus mykiss]
MHPTASPKVITLAASLSTAGDLTQLGQGRCGPLSQIPGGRLAGVKPIHVHTLRRKCPLSDSRDRKDSTWNVEGSTSSFLGREVSPLSRLGTSDNNYPEKDISERHFPFDKTWKNDSRMYPKYDFPDERPMKPSGSIPPLPRDYQIHRSGHLHHYTLHKELSQAPARPCAFGSYDLTSVPAILLPAAASLNGRNPFSTEGYKNRPRVNNRTCSLFTIGANQKCLPATCNVRLSIAHSSQTHAAQSYPDPVSGAPSASIIQRLSEIASLEGETVRQEKIKKIKKNRRQDS